MLPLDLKSFSVAAHWGSLPKGVDPLETAETVNDQAFPGAILPAVDPNGALYWYGVAVTDLEWRLLQPLLLAYVGPTVTGFNGQKMALQSDIPAEQLLIETGAYAVARIVPGQGCEQLAGRALSRLRKALALRPNTVSAVPLSTAQLLARLEMCLAVGDRAAAANFLQILREGLRLDTLNLHFLEVRILSTFRAWSELVSKDWFAGLAVARKPSAVAEVMLEALWFTFLSEIPDDSAELLVRYRASVQILARPLLGQVSAAAEGIVGKVRSLEGGPAPVPLVRGAAAQELLIQAAEAPSIARNSEAHAAIEALPSTDREILLHSGISRRAMGELEAAGELVPESWIQWLEMLGDARFTRAAAVAREGVSEWPAEQLYSQEQAKVIAEILVEIGLSADQRRDRLIDSIPSLVNWVKRDPDYPRRALREIYVALLQVFSLIESRGSAERDAAADLLDAILSLGVAAESYRQLLADFKALIDPGAGQSSIYWLVDVAAMLLNHPSPDPSERLEFLSLALGSFQHLLRLLTPGQRAAYNRVAVGASWPTLPVPLESETRADLASLRGKTIAIYTLTESAGRQADVAIRELQPDIKVNLAHDHVASPRLVRLARDADVFVLSAASAKHAATDCILHHRGDLPLLYAPGRGFSGILRVLEDYAARVEPASTKH